MSIWWAVTTVVWAFGSLFSLTAAIWDWQVAVDDERAYWGVGQEDRYWKRRRTAARRILLCWAWPLRVLRWVGRIVGEAFGRRTP